MSNPKPVNLSRRVFACNLMFGLLGIVILVGGLIAVFRIQVLSDHQNELNALVSRSKSLTNITFTVNGQPALQSLVERLANEESLTYCAVVGIDGTYLAHSNKRLVGNVHHDQSGLRNQTKFFEEIVVHQDDLTVHHLEVDLAKEDSTLASLRIAVANRQSWGQTWLLAARLPVLLIPAIGMVLLGGYFLQRIVKPLAQIHDQLVVAASFQSASECRLSLIPTTDAMSVGWNRVVEDVITNLPSLEDRMQEKVQSLHESRESRLLESLSDGIAQTDAEGKIMFLNSAMTALLGQEQDEPENFDSILGAFENCFGEEDLKELRNMLDPGACNRSAVAEFRKSIDTGERILRISRQPIRQHPMQSRQSDVNPGQAWSVRDVTQQRLADKARDDFLDSATHELRTPLANIKAYAETLELNEMIDIEQQKEFCNIINSEATRLSRFIDELLDISSIEAGSLGVQKQKVNLSRLIEDATASAQPLMVQKTIQFDLSLAEKLPEMMLDKDKFTTCLVNLLGNAAKYTPAGGKVTFRAKHGTKSIILEVEDTGIGIAEDELPKVFEKFFRSSDQRVHDENGTGLGLAFAAEVIKLHGGTLTANSQLNQGSVFIITLPIS